MKKKKLIRWTEGIGYRKKISLFKIYYSVLTKDHYIRPWVLVCQLPYISPKRFESKKEAKLCAEAILEKYFKLLKVKAY